MAVRRTKPPVRPGHRDHVRVNRLQWERQSNSYDRRFEQVLGGQRAKAWGVWRIPESRLHLLGKTRGRHVLELGCGGARWSIALARSGAKVLGLDISRMQLRHARREMRRSRTKFPLVRANAEYLPFAPESFDVVFCDWGAMTFCDPYRTVPEVGRVLRPGGRFAFATATPIFVLAESTRTYRLGRRLRSDYFGMHRFDYPREVNFQLTYGEWIRLFRENGFEVESLLEPRAPVGHPSRYLTPAEERWARHWPREAIWQLRKRE